MTTTTAMAAWLSSNIPAIACDEASGELFRDVQNAVEAIERMINRPISDQLCGKCMVDFEGSVCDLALYAPRHATEVICPRCQTTHNIERLFESTLNEADDKSFTITELHRTILPAVRVYVPQRTLQSWVARGWLVPTGYVDTEPRFMLEDVRRLHNARPQSGPTGAAAHKKRMAS